MIMKKKCVLLFCVFFLSIMCFCIQAEAHCTCKEVAKADSVYSVVDELPQFPGGDVALMTYLSQNLRYPDAMLKEKKSGRVMAYFVVSKKGKISDVSIKKTPDEGFNEEVIRVLTAMPKWKPAVKDGKKVSSGMTLPIMFRLPK